MRKYLALMNTSKANSQYRFLLARFNADYILKLPTAKDIKQVLGDLSIPEATKMDAGRGHERRMDEVYNRILGAIREQSLNTQKFAFRALSWIGYATRTLTVRELLEAISVEANQYQLDDSDMIRFEDLLGYCNGLVIADEQAVRLVHFSVRNYLDRHQAIPEDAKETYRAIACSTYLSFDALKRDPFEGLSSFPFLDYAANNLMIHLSKVERRHYPKTTSAVMKLLENKAHRRIYCTVNDSIRLQLDIPRLNLACEIGYEDAVRTLLEEGDVDVNGIDSRTGLTPLSWAVLRRHEAVIKRLLGEDRVDRHCNGSMPLSLAISRKEIRIVQFLVENGAVVNFAYDKVSQIQL